MTRPGLEVQFSIHVNVDRIHDQGKPAPKEDRLCPRGFEEDDLSRVSSVERPWADHPRGELKMAKSYTLRVGESGVIRRSFFGRTWSVAYAGMPTADTYSLAISWTVCHQSAAYNVFLPSDQREVPLVHGRLFVDDVSPQRVSLRYETR
jgi:hypothetical protein